MTTLDQLPIDGHFQAIINNLLELGGKWSYFFSEDFDLKKSFVKDDPTSLYTRIGDYPLFINHNQVSVDFYLHKRLKRSTIVILIRFDLQRDYEFNLKFLLKKIEDAYLRGLIAS